MPVMNKKAWKSPYLHRQKAQQMKFDNLQKSRHTNLDKSQNVTNNTSIYYAKSNLKEQGYHQWSLAELYKEELRLKQIAEQQKQRDFEIQEAQRKL